MIATASATQPKPASNPAVAPHQAVVFGSARNIARFAAMSNENTNDSPNTFAIFGGRSSARNPFSVIHALPNSAGEYHNPPRTKVDSAAATTAHQFTYCVCIASPRALSFSPELPPVGPAAS